MTKKLNSLKLHFEDDPILHEKCRKLTRSDILSDKVQSLIDNIKYTCDKEDYGVGLSANQVGESLAISVVAIKPTPGRPAEEAFNKVYINTDIVETFGDKVPMWEGCFSTARDEYGEPLMGPVPRYQKIHIKYLDRFGQECDEIIEGFIAHVVQHETDHLNGILFTDVIDSNSLVPYRDYKKIINIGR